jgi:hypothetical protein
MFEFVEDPVEINDGLLIKVLADFIETPEIQDGPFSMLSEFSFTDRVLARSDVVYGGLKEFDRYNGIHTHNGGIVFQGDDWEIYNGAYLHNGEISFRGGASKYKHDGTVLFGTGFRDGFAYDDFSASMHLDFVDSASLQEKLDTAVIGDGVDKFPSSQIYNGKMLHNGEYRWDASYDVFEEEQIGGMADAAAINEGLLEAELSADFIDSAAASGDDAEISAVLDLEDGASMNEDLAASISADLLDQVSLSDESAIGMIGYWKYGGEPAHSHDGSISFSYGVLVEI